MNPEQFQSDCIEFAIRAGQIKIALIAAVAFVRAHHAHSGIIHPLLIAKDRARREERRFQEAALA